MRIGASTMLVVNKTAFVAHFFHLNWTFQSAFLSSLSNRDSFCSLCNSTDTETMSCEAHSKGVLWAVTYAHILIS
jgi:hypothetical protein